MKLSLLLLALAVVPAAAQDDPILERSICERPYSAQHPLSRESVKTRWKDELEARDFAAVGGKIVAELRTHQGDAPRVAVFAANAEGALAPEKECCQLFAIKDKRKAGENKRRPVLFDGAIDLDDCAGGANAAALDELRHAAESFVMLGGLRNAPLKVRAVKVLTDKNAEYDRVLFEGFPMFPWESFVNGLLVPKDVMKGPPRDLVVLLHPSAGGEFQTGLRESRLAGALALEPLGWVHYNKSGGYRTWWGVSTLTTFRNDMGIGLGAAARYQNFLLGITWHDSDGDGRPFDSKPFIFVGMDLYQFAGAKLRRYEALRDEVREAVKAADSTTPR